MKSLRAFSLLACLVLLTASPTFADGREEAGKLNEEGIRLIAAGKPGEAIDAFKRARSLLPTDLTLRKNLATARSRYAAVLLKAGEIGEAVKELRYAAALEPGVALHHANLGAALVRMEDEVAGRKALEKALVVDPQCVPARAELGSLLYRRGELRKAIREWEKALVLDPTRKDLVPRLARAKRELAVEGGYVEEEREHFIVAWDGEKDATIGNDILLTLEDAYKTIGADLGVYPRKKVRVVLYTEKEFRAVTGAHAWVGGLYDGSIRIPVKNFRTAQSEIRGTLYHEYTHVAVGSLTNACPAWLNEGLAQVYEKKDKRPSLGRTATAKKRGAMLSLSQLGKSFTRFKDPETARLAYAQSHLLTLFLIDEHGPDRIGRFLRALADGKTAAAASEDAFHRSLAQIFAAWEAGI